MENKISIIVPIFNSEKTLKRCIDSIINQTYQNIEIILINDGSTDNSLEIAKKYKDNYSEKIKLFDNKNMGVAETRNFGVQKASGEYFLYVDADDYIEKNLCEELINFTKNKVDIIKYKMNIIKEKDLKISGPIFEEKNGEEAFNNLCFADTMIDTPCLYLFKREFFVKNEFKFLKNTYHEDFGLIPIIILKARNVISTNIYGYNYVQEENSITRNDDYKKTVKKANDLLLHYDNMIKELEKIDIKKETKENIKLYYTNSILNAIKKLEKKAKKEYKKEIKKRKLVRNIKVKNLKSFVKKIFYKIIIIG